MGVDFTVPAPPQLTFTSGVGVNVPSCATFGIIDDNNLEFDHEFTVTLSSVTPAGPVLSSISSTTTVTITDDEGILTVIIFDMSSI